MSATKLTAAEQLEALKGVRAYFANDWPNVPNSRDFYDRGLEALNTVIEAYEDNAEMLRPAAFEGSVEELKRRVEAMDKERSRPIALDAKPVARATHADVRCRFCGVHHEIGTFRDALYREVKIASTSHAGLYAGDIGTVVDWQWRRGSTEWIRVEFDGPPGNRSEKRRANFAPCQLRRAT